MIFDQPPAELPVATLRPRDSGVRLLLDARRWLVSKGRWLRPRAIPVTAAFLGMLAGFAWLSYRYEVAHHWEHEQLPAPVVTTTRGEDPLVRIRIESHPAGTGTFVAWPGSEARTVTPELKLEPGIYRVVIEPSSPATAAPAPATPAAR